MKTSVRKHGEHDDFLSWLSQPAVGMDEPQAVLAAHRRHLHPLPEKVGAGETPPEGKFATAATAMIAAYTQRLRRENDELRRGGWAQATWRTSAATAMSARRRISSR